MIPGRFSYPKPQLTVDTEIVLKYQHPTKFTSGVSAEFVQTDYIP